jgi:hypothetical protein
MARSESKPIGDVVGDLADLSWCKELIDRDIRVDVYTYQYGDEIKLHRRDIIGLVLRGQVEVCDSRRLSEKLHKATDYVAYRPVRILRRAEFFEDFPFLDMIMHVPVPEIGYGQRWGLYAGGHSTIVKFDLGGNHEFRDETMRIQPDVFVSKHVKQETVVAYIRHHDLVEGRELYSALGCFRDEIIRQCWTKAQSYRTGLNTHSLNLLTEFRAISESAWDALENHRHEIKTWHKIPKVRKGSVVYTKSGNIVYKSCKAVDNSAKTVILYVFADALLDAIWRPIRRDPVFGSIGHNIDAAVLSRLNSRFKSSDILTAAKIDEAGPLFYYPIDLHNLEINEHCAAQASTLTAAVDALRIERSSKDGDGKRAMDFYKDLATECIKRYVLTEGLKNYPYIVECRKVECLIGQMLILEFRRK